MNLNFCKKTQRQKLNFGKLQSLGFKVTLSHLIFFAYFAMNKAILNAADEERLRFVPKQEKRKIVFFAPITTLDIATDNVLMF